MKELVVLGGPNGAGKTTAAQIVLPRKLNIIEFINADEIARGLSPFNPEATAVAAGRLMLERMVTLATGPQSFAFETTCSRVGHVRFLEKCKSSGWRIILVFPSLPSPEIAVERVARRVAMGGHAIPRDTIIHRYWAGLNNMRLRYLPLADVAAIYDNAGDQPIMIAERFSGDVLSVHDPVLWKSIEEASP